MIYNSEERIGVYSVAKNFSENLGWIFREQPISDFGIDGFVEVTRFTNDLKSSIPTGKLIGVQIKSGKSFFKESTDNHFVFRGAKKHLNYWLNYSIPVIILLYDKEKQIAYWESVNESTVHIINKSFKVIIPKENVLERKSRESLNSIAIFKGKYEYKLWLLQASINPIKLLIQKDLFLYVEIDSIPYSKDYHISLVLTDEDNNSLPTIIHSHDENPNLYKYHFYLSEGKSIKEGINDMLPWANLFLDKLEFSDIALTEQLAEIALRCGTDNSDEDVQKVLELKRDNSFLALACYLADSSCFRLKLKANALAHNFLAVNDFLEKEPTVKQTMFL